jgi:hypothetical protein
MLGNGELPSRFLLLDHSGRVRSLLGRHAMSATDEIVERIEANLDELHETVEVARDLLGHAPSRSVWDCGCEICERVWRDR